MLALEVNSVTKTYGNTDVVDNVSFNIKKGEIFGLLGPNGAGKSTLINMMAGIVKANAGEIKVFGNSVTEKPLITKSLLGVMHQEFVAETFFKVGPGLKIHSGYYGVPDNPEWRNILIDRLELREHLQKKFIMLSGGMKRRYMLAKALIHQPPFLILDEPTAGVDIELRLRLWEFVREINEAGVTVLLTTHYLEEAEQMCDRIAILNRGKVIALDETRTLLSNLDSKKVCFKIEDDLTELNANLQALGASYCSENRTICIPINSQTSTAEALGALGSLGVNVIDISVNEPDLEDLFISLVGENAANKP